MLKPDDFFDLEDFDHKGIFTDVEHVWEALLAIKPYIKEHLSPNTGSIGTGTLPETCVLWNGETISDDDCEIEPGDATKGQLKVFRNGEELPGATVIYAGAVLFDSAICIGQGTVVEPGALIKGPTIIGSHTEVRQGAYIRGNCIIGDRCVVGHATEVKNAIMLDDAKAGHFAYIGDSILGKNVNLGAGTKLANLKIIDVEMKISIEGKEYKTGLRKFGAILGDDAETGCNSVTSPGTMLGKRSLVYPCINVAGGYYPTRSIISPRRQKRPFKKKK